MKRGTTSVRLSYKKKKKKKKKKKSIIARDIVVGEKLENLDTYSRPMVKVTREYSGHIVLRLLFREIPNTGNVNRIPATKGARKFSCRVLSHRVRDLKMEFGIRE